jgi:hypothetical protein
MMAEVGFRKDLALAAAGALTEDANTKFGDRFDPNRSIAVVKKFLASDIGTVCRSCGWRKSGTKYCTQKQAATSDDYGCDEFRHLFVVEDD